MKFIEIPGFVSRAQVNGNMEVLKESTVSGGDAVSTEETDNTPVEKPDADTAEEEIDITVEDMESLTLADDTLSYIAATNTCISFGVFLLVGLLLAKIVWGHFN